MKKLLLIVLSCITLTACVQKAKTINEAVAGKKETEATAETKMDNTAEPSATPEVEMNEYEVTAPADETEPIEGENKDIAYKEGYFEELYAKLVEKYPSGYQSFDKDSLLDLYGDRETDFFEDGIGYVSQENGCYNQVFVLKNLDEENGEQFVNNIINPITEDPSVSGKMEYETYDWEDVTVVCIGEQEFLNSVRKMVEDLFSGYHE